VAPIGDGGGGKKGEVAQFMKEGRNPSSFFKGRSLRRTWPKGEKHQHVVQKKEGGKGQAGGTEEENKEEKKKYL